MWWPRSADNDWAGKQRRLQPAGKRRLRHRAADSRLHDAVQQRHAVDRYAHGSVVERPRRQLSVVRDGRRDGARSEFPVVLHVSEYCTAAVAAHNSYDDVDNANNDK
jgi:hypothetical protein